MLRTYRGCVPPGLRPAQRPGPPAPPPHRVAGCTSTSTPPWSSIIPITRRRQGDLEKTYGHHPLLAFVDRPEIAGGEALAAYCAPVARAPTPQLTTSVS
ncbi:hypothetical protein MBOU_45760 [Mycobacterium bourgelatii]|uniref:Uncharacterized protein n=1 Tax=Mycobacterium bourgelatii TaxID=1273442 RepID=A0A7I9YV06_MYCBU|nr:hypothetical protein MBOU_45760 [Mycobacterium bourgelatii]